MVKRHRMSPIIVAFPLTCSWNGGDLNFMPSTVTTKNVSAATERMLIVELTKWFLPDCLQGTSFAGFLIIRPTARRIACRLDSSFFRASRHSLLLTSVQNCCLVCRGTIGAIACKPMADTWPGPPSVVATNGSVPAWFCDLFIYGPHHVVAPTTDFSVTFL